MYIHSVVSHLGGWQILHHEYAAHLKEIEAALQMFQLPPKPGHGCMERAFAEQLVPLGWEPEVQAGKRRLDFAKSGVGLDLRLFGMPAQPHPFVVAGFSDLQPPAVEVLELTSQLDLFLLDAIGMTLEEALDLQERPNYDFKELLPENRAVAEQACGLANLPGGGMLLVGRLRRWQADRHRPLGAGRHATQGRADHQFDSYADAAL